MRRFVFLTACLLALASATSLGQRAGGSRAGTGFASRAGMHAAGRASFLSAPRSNPRPGHTFHSPNRGPVFVHRRRFDGHRQAWRFAGYPYYYYGWYGGPFGWDWESSLYASRDNGDDAQYRTAAEINRLADEVQELREQRDYVQAPPAPAPQPRTEAKLAEDLPVVLVFLDKRIQEVKCYVVANEMLVVLEGNRRKKFPLADIDLAATLKLNDERGVDFQVPNPVMTQ